MTTDDLMQLALEMVRWTEVPGDSAIFRPGKNIRRVLLGIDIGAAELKLAKDLGYDCCIAHHPMSQLMGAWKVYEWHVDQMVAAGVSKHDALQAVTATLTRSEILSHIYNYDHLRSVAALLEMPFLNIHSPCDEIGRRIIQGKIDETLKAKPQATVGDIVDAIGTIGEFRNAETQILVRLGRRENQAGRVVFSHAALTNGGAAVANAYFKHGTGTVVYIHIAPEELARLQQDNLGNLIVTGHIASDSVGINPYVARLRDAGIEIDTFSGIVASS